VRTPQRSLRPFPETASLVFTWSPGRYDDLLTPHTPAVPRNIALLCIWQWASGINCPKVCDHVHTPASNYRRTLKEDTETAAGLLFGLQTAKNLSPPAMWRYRHNSSCCREVTPPLVPGCSCEHPHQISHPKSRRQCSFAQKPANPLDYKNREGPQLMIPSTSGHQALLSSPCSNFYQPTFRKERQIPRDTIRLPAPF